MKTSHQILVLAALLIGCGSAVKRPAGLQSGDASIDLEASVHPWDLRDAVAEQGTPADGSQRDTPGPADTWPGEALSELASDHESQPDTIGPWPDLNAHDTASADLGSDAPSWPSCLDMDGDGFGTGCAAGPDCDDWNPYFGPQCPDCASNPFLTGCACSAPADPFECFDDNLMLAGHGECRTGQRACIGGFWTECVGQVLPSFDLCDGVDNDCDDIVDNGWSALCGCNVQCEEIHFGPGTEHPFETGTDTSSNVGLTGDGDLTLPYFAQGPSVETFIWIANSAENTVSKLDTETGEERGRYAVCTDPSRTSVDVYGSVWVGCRGDARVAKIAHALSNCVDRNGNGIIETSADLNGNHVIDLGTAEILPQGQDECVLFVVQPEESSAIARALAVDKDNHCWVGFWNTQRLLRLSPVDGSVVHTIQTQGSPYGLVIDQVGTLWVSFRGEGWLGRIDLGQPETIQYLTPPGCVQLYGITVDRFGRIWLGNSNCGDLLMYDPPLGTWTHVALDPLGWTRGVAATVQGYVCTAHHEWSCIRGQHVSCIDDVTLTPTPIALGTAMYGSVGVAFDKNENLWVVNQCNNTASKIDVSTGTLLGEFPVGNGPYTYSDMTGYALHSFVIPDGWHDLVASSGGTKVFRWMALMVEATLPPGTSLSVQLRASESPEALAQAVWSLPYGPFPPLTFPLDLTDPALLPYLHGDFLQVRLILHAEDATSSPVVHRVEVAYQ